MGYTHYWTAAHPAPADAFGQTSLAAIAVCDWAEGEGIKLAGWDGGDEQAEPEFTEGYVSLNGFGDDAYETFRLNAVPDPKRLWDFCKTGEAPYDIVVCVILLRALHFGLLVEVTSDGDWDGEWLEARKVYADLFGEVPPSIAA